MTMTCLNCKSTLICGCQRKTASNGAQVCTYCLSSYEFALKNRVQVPQRQQYRVPQPILTPSVPPSNVQVTYRGSRIDEL